MSSKLESDVYHRVRVTPSGECYEGNTWRKVMAVYRQVCGVINDKNCSLSIVLTATDEKLQKS